MRLRLDNVVGEMNGSVVRVSGDLTVTVPQFTRFGATAWPKDHKAMLSAWPRCGYTREFSKSDGMVLTPSGTNKYAYPISGAWHTSWKGEIEDIATHQWPEPRFWTWYHEPADNMSAAMYRDTAARLPALLNASPSPVLGNGPILTRWQIFDRVPPIDPATYAYPGMTFFGGDSYNTSDTAYRTPERMFGAIRDAARDLGVPWMVPEWGAERLTKDSSGTGRASWIRDCFQFFDDHDDCLAVGWWDIGGCRISHQPSWPEFAALAERLS